MSTTGDTDPMVRFASAGTARSTLQAWADGAYVLHLLTAVRDKGWTAFLTESRSVEDLAAYSGLTPERVADIVDVLEAYGVVGRREETVRLTAEFAALSADDAWVGLDELLDRIELTARLVPATAEAGPLPLAESDALVVARSSGGNSTRITRALFDQLFLPKLPELIDVVRTERWLDVGCGVAGSTLTLAGLFPELKAVALELVPTVAAETRLRAAAQRVADRVDIRTTDVRDFDERDAFGGAFWAQPFFPEATRAATLATILRALRPGGLLFLQEMEPVPDQAARPAYTMRRLVAQAQGIPFGRTAEELTDETMAAGFEPVRVAQTDFGRIVIVRRPG
ncbi:SAM-dependent methyltransferase [Kribbella sp. NPDC004536]|uniref:SAM-dependent methyltransferase n=1 Tax=Kribbella sp. NPDC004536 TaxID=3364106 RepID=UPI0036A61DDD